ncbi:phosphopantetheine-binding protein [Streptomyces sp. NPDC058086]|uniref:acyl carrier protein n=1 Tax=Streptomyces sp. NPDC058086 TaxID=3346334 RepID=UPI0036F03C26
MERLRRCVAGVMGYGPDRIDPDVPLTDLGLDSLTAARIRGVVEREFGVVVEPGTLLRQGALRAVADLLGAGETPPSSPPREPARHPADPLSLRVLSATGTPLLLAHAAGGSSAVYTRPAERLGGQRPLYGFDRQEDPDDVPGRAAEFARWIRRALPSSPWIVGGWSYGGVLAQEAARLIPVRHRLRSRPARLGAAAARPTWSHPSRRGAPPLRGLRRPCGTHPRQPVRPAVRRTRRPGRPRARIDLVLKVLGESVSLGESTPPHR